MSVAKFTFSPAVRANVPLLLGFSGGTGSGKTFTAMEVATGLSGDKKFAVIDTENGRALHYADRFSFDHAELRAPFRPDAYLDAIVAADDAGYPAVLVDSMSHVWAGDGGVLDWQEEELDRMAGTDWKKREACKMAAWIKPKVAHKRMVSRLLQMRCHVILCFRAEQKVEMKRDESGKMKIEAKESPTGLHGWIPICEKNLPFELTASFLLTADKPGIVKPIKLQEQHRTFFPLDRAVNRETGRLLGDWARGGVAGSASTIPTAQAPDIQALSDVGETKARAGTAALRAWWAELPSAARTALKATLDSEWKRLAEAADSHGNQQG